MKRIFLGLMLIIMTFTLASCTIQDNNRQKTEEDEQPKDELIELTIEELSMYDGKDGNKAYVAVNGTIYDVTDIPAWTGGTHNGNMAGTDVTDVINNAPHGESILDDLTIVGTIKE